MKEREYDSSRYEWKFRINDQPWGWNSDVSRGNEYCTKDSQNIDSKLRKKGLLIFDDGTIKEYESVLQISKEYNIFPQTIYSCISSDGFYRSNKHGFTIKYGDEKKPYKGLIFNSQRQKWIIRVFKDGRRIALGSYSTKEQAIIAYDGMRNQL